MNIELHRKELDRIANVEDYDDDDDAMIDGEALLGIALAFERAYDSLLTENKVMRAALEDIHQYEGTSYAHARTVAHQGLSGEYSTQVMQSKCQKCGDTYSGAFCPCSYEVQDDDPAQVGPDRD